MIKLLPLTIIILLALSVIVVGVVKLVGDKQTENNKQFSIDSETIQDISSSLPEYKSYLICDIKKDVCGFVERIN